MTENRTFGPTPSIRDLTKLEYAKCAKDPIYFIKKYVFIQAERGKTTFNMYLFQEQVTNLFLRYKRMSIVKSRQIGVTTLCSAYALWLMLFHGDRQIICLAPTQEKAKIIVNKVIYAYENLPSWFAGSFNLKPKKKNVLSLELENGSKIQATTGAKKSSRGFSAHLLIIDEAAFIDHAEEIWGTAQQTLTEMNGQALVLSTPNGVGNWFHKNHVAGENRENEFVPVKLPWTVVPHRTKAWREELDREIGPRLARQEGDADFESSGNTVISPEIIKFYSEEFGLDPVEQHGVNKDYWLWKQSTPGVDYAIVSDVARGDGQDYSTFHVIDLFSNEQVAEYKGLIDTTQFANMLVSEGYKWNQALIIIERESIGWAVITQVLETGYPNLYYSPKEGMVMDAETYYMRNYDNDHSRMVPGFSTNTKFRPLVINSFIQMIEQKLLIVHSKRSFDEWRTFIWSETNKASAQKGYNDDLIIPLGIYGFLRDTAIKFSKVGMNMTRTALDNISKGVPNKLNTYNSNQKKAFDQWNMKTPNGKNEDITWLND